MQLGFFGRTVVTVGTVIAVALAFAAILVAPLVGVVLGFLFSCYAVARVVIYELEDR